MKKYVLWVLGLVLLIISGCGHDSTYRTLVQVDSALVAGHLDSALVMMSGIDTSKISSDDERAYFFLMRTQLLYRTNRPMSDSSDIDMCVSHYSGKGSDGRKLACAYYYKGMLEYERGMVSDAVMSLKKAEAAAASLNDVELKHKIYESLSTVNFMTGNVRLAMKYTNLSLECARMTDNGLWLAYAWNHQACLYDAIGEKDSFNLCIRRCMPYIESIGEKDKARILFLTGMYYLRRGDNAMAKLHLRKSYDMNPLASTCNMLAGIYSREGNKEKAMALWRQTLRKAAPEEKADILESVSRHLFDDRKYRDAYLSLSELVSLRDSLSELRQTAKVQEIQLKYDQQTAKRQFDKTLIRALYAFICFITAGAVFVYYHIYKTNKTRRKLMYDQILLNDYNRKISDLERHGKNSEKTINRLKHKVEQIQNEHIGIMFEGHALYDDIMKNKSVVAWTKSDVAKFIEYYKAVNLPFLIRLENDYTGLTDGNRLFLILQDIGKSDDEITRILGTSSGAIRTMRHRLRGKMKKERSDE